MEEWKNSRHFDASSHIPLDRMKTLLHEIWSMGIKAIEITGGGEPLAYPHVLELLQELKQYPMDIALVTNGTLLKDKVADALYETQFQWGRVSFDAGSKEDYCRIRRCSESHWDMAWRGVKNLVERRKSQVIGTGFVVTDQNYAGIYDHCVKAKDFGVNNVRIAVAFTSKGADLLDQEQKAEARRQLDLANNLNCDEFHVVDLFDERINNLRLSSDKQDYEYCGVKDLLCVIEGEGNVYTCCTLTGTSKGLIGNILTQPLDNLWVHMSNWRKNFDPRKMCRCTCLYEKRNKVMLSLRQPPKHINFI
jgi:radical SAM protein with 4Fe4S-binding SPASM domain